MTTSTVLKAAVVSGVASKVDTFRYDDPKFAQIEPTVTVLTRVLQEPIYTVAGVSYPLAHRSKEGFSSGGYDKNFNVL